MTICLSWEEVGAIIARHVHVNLPGVELGNPQIHISTPYGPESTYQDGDVSIEFPILQDQPAPAPAAIPAIADDVPF